MEKESCSFSLWTLAPVFIDSFGDLKMALDGAWAAHKEKQQISSRYLEMGPQILAVGQV